MLWRAAIYASFGLSLGVFGADLVHGLEQGRLHLHLIVDVWPNAGAGLLDYVGTHIDPGGIILGQPAAPALCLVALALWLIGGNTRPRPKFGQRRMFR
jgi:hypothetical protein